MNPVTVGKTNDHAVLGILVNFARSAPYYLAPEWTGDGDLMKLEEHLEETPCYVTRGGDNVVFPRSKTLQLLNESWLSNRDDG